MCVTLIKSSTQVRRIPVSIVICFKDMQRNMNLFLPDSIEPKSFPRPKALYLVDLYFFILSSTPCLGGGTHPVTHHRSTGLDMLHPHPGTNDQLCFDTNEELINTLPALPCALSSLIPVQQCMHKIIRRNPLLGQVQRTSAPLTAVDLQPGPSFIGDGSGRLLIVLRR